MQVKWIKLGSVASTNSYISELISKDRITEELVVFADYQDSGKGQGGNQWHSRKGDNLLMSLLLFPAFLSASQQFQISRMASLAICDTLYPMGLDPLIKWPNDILAGEGKIAGILIEHGITGKNISHTILGIGMNLNQTKFPEFPVKATSVLLEKGIAMEPLQVAKELINHLTTRYNQLYKGESGVMEREYLERLFRMGQPASFKADGKSFKGIILGVNEFGELLVEGEGRIKSYGYQEIKMEVRKLES